MRPTVIVSGAIAHKALNGGNAWSRLSWVLGFKRLGFEVWFIEQIPKAFGQSVNLAYFRSAMKQAGLQDTSALICEEGETIWGVPFGTLSAVSKNAVVFNIGGHLRCSDIKDTAACRIY